MESLEWPPEKTDDDLFELHSHIKDYQMTHGSLIKLVDADDDCGPLSMPIGVTMFPSLFPKRCFEHGLQIQMTYNELYIRIAEDPKWLHDVLKGLIDSDPLTKTLWHIYEQVHTEGVRQPISLGIFRSDYMLNGQSISRLGPSSLKQVELNTFSCAGGTHGNIANGMHHHLARMGCYSTDNEAAEKIPENSTIEGIINVLSLAHKTYLENHSLLPGYSGAILMPIQPNNVNICDERPIEYGLWSQDPPIPCFRCIFSEEILDRCTLDLDTGALVYTHPLLRRTYEITVVYMRAGYDSREFSIPSGPAARLLLERSRAIKCPSLLSHLSTFKKVQQVLTEPGALEHFLPPSSLTAIRETFMLMYALDPSTSEGEKATLLALNPVTAANYILKPSLEGGGHNVYGAEIPGFLEKTPKHLWPNYVLMERIEPPASVENSLLSPTGIYQGPVVSELGVFGAVLWRRKSNVEAANGEDVVDIIENRGATGWSFKTKARHIDEMSVIKGYGCFDSPYLV